MKENGSAEGKKLLIIHIAQILQRHSNESHPLSQQRILELLETECGMTAERKAVRRNLERLREAGLPLECRKAERVTNGKRESISLDWYWRHELSEEEFHTVLDALYFSPLPAQRIRQLVEKLEAGRSCYFDDGKEAVKNIPDADYPARLARLRPLVRLLSAAVAEKRKVIFSTDHYEADGKWHHDSLPGGEVRVHKASPYQLFAAGGAYFLLANPDGEETVRIFPVSRLSDAVMTEEEVRPQRSLDAIAGGILPSHFLTAGTRAFPGEPVKCTMEVAPELLSECIEDFGRAMHIASATESRVLIEAEIPLSMAAAWALASGGRAKVTGPPALVREVRSAAERLAKLYGGGG